jgi:hypothetical protein
VTPDEIASRNQALLVIGACAIGALAYAGFWLLTSEHWVAVRLRVIMSRSGEASAPAADTSAVHVSIPRSDTPTDTNDDDDIMPRIGRRLSDTEIVAMLAVQRGKDNKWRFSANQIAALVGGSHNDVMAQIRALRSGPVEPVYPERPHPLEKFKVVN